MELVSTEQMRDIEQRASLEYGLEPRTLMESAGLAAFGLVKRVLGGSVDGRRILICAGKGNNGGDALVLARYLANAGGRVIIVLVADSRSLQGLAAEVLLPISRMIEAQNKHPIADRQRIKLIECSEPNWPAALKESLPVDLVVDGLLGTGIKSPLSGVYRELVTLINSLECPCVALDIPTGVNPDTGEVDEVCIKADHTITFGRPKLGLLSYPAYDFIGQLTVNTIGIPDSLVRQAAASQVWVRPELVAALLPPRPASAHKGSFGHVLTIGGSMGLTGAACLAAMAVLRSGAGKSTLAGPASLHSVLATKLTEVMTVPLPETEAHSISTKANEVIKTLGEFEAILVGPGLSTYPETTRFLLDFLTVVQGSLVLDADALNIMATDRKAFSSLLADSSVPPVLTPHPAELARLLGISTHEVQKSRVAMAREAARRWQSIVVLKGANTVIATPTGMVYVNTTGGSELATAGTGDVLAGIIAGFIAQGAHPEAAAIIGVYLHGLSGTKARQAGLGAGLVAGDLLDYLPFAIEECWQNRLGSECNG